jgi:hypothetical protein
LPVFLVAWVFLVGGANSGPAAPAAPYATGCQNFFFPLVRAGGEALERAQRQLSYTRRRHHIHDRAAVCAGAARTMVARSA